jgi:hypothetical protein
VSSTQSSSLANDVWIAIAKTIRFWDDPLVPPANKETRLSVSTGGVCGDESSFPSISVVKGDASGDEMSMEQFIAAVYTDGLTASTENNTPMSRSALDGMTCGDEIDDDGITLDEFMAVVYADETGENPLDNNLLP